MCAIFEIAMGLAKRHVARLTRKMECIRLDLQHVRASRGFPIAEGEQLFDMIKQSCIFQIARFRGIPRNANA